MKAPTQPLTSTPPAVFIVQPRGLGRYWGLFRRACVAAYEDNCFGIAKGAAYSALLAFFPMLATIAAILVQANAEAVSRVLSRFLFQVVPPGSENLVERQFTVSGQRPVWLLVGATLLTLWAASGAMMSLMEGFQAAYRLPAGRPFLRQRLVAFLMVITLALPAVGASALILFGSRIERSVYDKLGVAPEGQEIKAWIPVVGTGARYLVALGTVILVTALLYYFGPNKSMKLKRAWPGALLATVFWMIATLGFGWYVRNIANYNVMYGSIGAVIALLVWMYLLAIVALLGCEYNAERDRMAGC
jgi:membrane protein